MLRALAGYLLGGILNDSTEQPMECETREVNDWLVVNMPNKPEESDLDLNSEIESDIDEREVLDDQDIDFDSNAGSETDEDEILTCLPMLMSYDELEYQKPIFEEKTPIEEISSVVLYNPKNKVQTIQTDDSRLKPYGQVRCNVHPISTCMEIQSRMSEPPIESCTCPKIPRLRVFRLRWSPLLKHDVQCPLSSIRKNHAIASESAKSLDDEGMKCTCSDEPRSPRYLFISAPQPKPAIAMSHGSELMGDIRRARQLQTPTYINHRPPSPVITKADVKKQLQEQIKEIRPAQQAKVLSLKKQNSRSQLKRHNQNYIYCSSAKASRRKDLQRNHSGVNNNRKCF